MRRAVPWLLSCSFFGLAQGEVPSHREPTLQLGAAQAQGVARALSTQAAPCQLPAMPTAQGASTAQDLAVEVPEAASGFRAGLQPVRASGFMVVTANPLASLAACEVLQAGGHALDAAVAAQMVLGLLEPQSSGLGGGGFLLHFDAGRGELRSYDGRETAPALASPADLQAQPGAATLSPRVVFEQLRSRGSAIGTPGLVRMLAQAHGAHGKLPWAALLQPAQRLAEQGFEVSPRLAQAIAQARAHLRLQPEAAAYFLHPDGSPKAAGTWLRNPAYAQTLKALAQGGADAFYTADLAQAIVQAAQAPLGTNEGGKLSLSDLAQYRAIEREPVCSDYRQYHVCGIGPPSAGGLMVAQVLGMLERFDLPALKPSLLALPDAPASSQTPALANPAQARAARAAPRYVPHPDAVHWVSEALRLAYADRNAYIADPDALSLPASAWAALFEADYVAARAARIDPARSMGVAPAGDRPALFQAPLSASEGKGTTHLSIVDRQGNAVALTSSIESSMGAYRWAGGFLLNNQMTDFAWPSVPGPQPVNHIAPGKRPRSSMAPTMVFARKPDGSRGDLLVVTGSPGGPAIVPYVLKTLLAVLDWGLDAQAAADLPHFGAFNTPVTFVEVLPFEHASSPAQQALPESAAQRQAPRADVKTALQQGLLARGHQLNTGPQTSGVGLIVRQAGQWVGGVDPRREGLALGGP